MKTMKKKKGAPLFYPQLRGLRWNNKGAPYCLRGQEDY